MSGVYKSLLPKDVRTTPYRAHKSLITTFTGGQPDNDDCKVFDAEHSLSSSYNFMQQGITNLDYGNPYFTGAFATTTDGYYKTAIHSQLDHLFYKKYLENNMATLGGGAGVSLQYRDLGAAAQVVSYPTKKVGEGILPQSLQLTASSYTVIDDGYGNLRFDDQTDAADYDNVMISYTFNKYYAYVGEGTVSNITQQYTYGSYKMQASYTNVGFELADSNGSVAAKFGSGSVIELKPNTEQKQIYNMFNRDYAIAFKIKLTQTPTLTKVLLAKQDLMDDVAVDLDGNLYTNTNVPTQYPYKVEVTTSRALRFTKSDTVTVFTITTSALTLNTWYDVVIQRVGNVFTIYLNGSADTSATDPFYANTPNTNFQSREQDCGNRSNIYIGNNYNQTQHTDCLLQYFHIFNRSLTVNEISNLNVKSGWLNNYCGNVFYRLGLVVLTHPLLVNEDIDEIKVKSTVSMREVETYCTIGPGEYNITNNRTIQYWNPVHNQMEIDTRYTGSLFRPYITTIGLYNDNNELLVVAKLSTPIQTSRTTDTTFVVRFDY